MDRLVRDVPFAAGRSAVHSRISEDILVKMGCLGPNENTVVGTTHGRVRCAMTGTKWMLAAWMLMPLLGCASLTDYKYEKTQRSRARSAWRDHGSNCKPNCYGKDYQKGWKDGFYDVATGGKGCPPVVAPVTYWKPSQIGFLEHDPYNNIPPPPAKKDDLRAGDDR